MLKLLIAVSILVCCVVYTEAGCGCTPLRAKRQLFQKRGGDDTPVRVEADMVFSKKDFAVYSGFRASISPQSKWPNNEIPYSFVPQFSGDARQKVGAALAEFTRETNGCVRFREIPYGSKEHHVQVFSSDGCWSLVGRATYQSPQQLSLAEYGCLGAETIKHEFMHALGFYHEQSRPDRDSYITVNWNSIDSNMCSNFEKCRGCATTTSYDIVSIMQYQGDAFTCDGRPTMVGKNGKPTVRNYVTTQSDIAKVKAFYGCR